MAHLWYQNESEWIVEKLPAERSLDNASNRDASIVEIFDPAGGTSGHVLLAAPASLLVNGEPLLTGIRVLRDRDEIVCRDGRRHWYSTERLPEVEPYRPPDTVAGDGGRARCPRCRQRIDSGELVVACPKCGALYHQAEARPCFSYHDQCVTCGGPTAEVGEANFGWTPCGL